MPLIKWFFVNTSKKFTRNFMVHDIICVGSDIIMVYRIKTFTIYFINLERLVRFFIDQKVKIKLIN